MGRPSNAQLAERRLMEETLGDEPEVKVRSGPKITYAPVSESAPYETIWNKHRFKANIPVVVHDVSGGNTAAQMIESAKGNPDFMVEGFPRAVARSLDPETPEQYRSYAVGWIRITNSSAELRRRWNGEKDLRDECGVGIDDEEYLASIYNPRLATLKDAEKLAVAAVND